MLRETVLFQKETIFRIPMFWDVMLHCWVFLLLCSWGGRSSGMWCCVAGWVLLQWY